LADASGISFPGPASRPSAKQVSVTHAETQHIDSEARKLDFDWQSFTTRVQELNDAVYSQLIKTQHEMAGSELHIYPRKRIIKTILSRENNKRILIEAAGTNVKITIHDENDTPSNVKNDETLSKLSAIMGGEVMNDGGGNPF
jgi:hypothetical protein